VTLPDVAAHVVLPFADEVRPLAGVQAFYAGGSLGTGDFHAGVSDFDLVAIVEEPLTTAQQDDVQALHRRVIAAEPLATKLHCFYVPRDQLADVTQEHLNWAHEELYSRPLSGVARAELLRHGVTVFGPPPGEVLPPVTHDDLAAAAKAELSGYWRGALAKPHLWLQDVYVDLGLITLARVEATLTDGRLITKAEALSMLPALGVDPGLVREIATRRAGGTVEMSLRARQRRALHARRVMSGGIDRLLRG
jgi:Nucleotidyltransferase domain